MAGGRGWDKVLLGLYGVMTPLIIPLVAGLDFRFGWPPEAAGWLQVAGLVVRRHDEKARSTADRGREPAWMAESA